MLTGGSRPNKGRSTADLRSALGLDDQESKMLGLGHARWNNDERALVRAASGGLTAKAPSRGQEQLFIERLSA